MRTLGYIPIAHSKSGDLEDHSYRVVHVSVLSTGKPGGAQDERQQQRQHRTDYQVQITVLG